MDGRFFDRLRLVQRREQVGEVGEILVVRGMMTITEFLELTKNAYGGDVIRKVIDRMEA